MFLHKDSPYQMPICLNCRNIYDFSTANRQTPCTHIHWWWMCTEGFDTREISYTVRWNCWNHKDNCSRTLEIMLWQNQKSHLLMSMDELWLVTSPMALKRRFQHRRNLVRHWLKSQKSHSLPRNHENHQEIGFEKIRNLRKIAAEIRNHKWNHMILKSHASDLTS